LQEYKFRKQTKTEKVLQGKRPRSTITRERFFAVLRVTHYQKNEAFRIQEMDLRALERNSNCESAAFLFEARERLHKNAQALNLKYKSKF